MNLKRILTPGALAAALLASVPTNAATVVLTNDVTANTTWFATNTYTLRTVVYVRTNITLTIEPGTVIKAATSGLIARDGIPNLVAALWVARGAKLNAVGTVDKPIIFTFDGDDVSNPNDVSFDTSGQWGGIVLCGKAQINSAASTAGNVATPNDELFEGTTTDGTNGVHLFGGADDDDNSGTLRYVSIRYPGTVFAPAKELNGLTMGAVGRGTDISYVEVLNSSDDAFEWWGGTVNTHHLIAAFCEDDDFDTDQGYRGTNQFWFGIKPPWNGSTDSRGFETDGDLNQSASGELPKSQWTVHNATLIGRGKAVTGFGGGIGWNARDEAAPNVINSIFTEFAAGVKVDTDGTNEFFTGQGDLRNSIFNVGTAMSDANSDYLFTDASRLNTLQDPLLGGISYTNRMGLDPRPQPGSPALGNVAPQPAPLAQTAYRGAFGPGDHWADGWTALSQGGNLVRKGSMITVSGDITNHTTWRAENTYLLPTVVYVKSNATLVIEPGTVIKAATSGLLARDGIPNLVAALWVARGGKLYATGTVSRPIIFTFDGDDVNNPNDVAFDTSGQWGGIVLCGKAQINSAASTAGNVANPKYELFEGTTTDGTNGVHLFGGADDNDSSGALRYVSIRYPGTVFAPAKELNGLTMGAVGRGTDISYVEVLNSSDDAFEWWGGTVNTHHLIAAFCEDDDFDTDQGYRGTNQFWFGIKPPWNGSTDSRGFETDGDLNQSASGELPKSQWTVHNATLIGRGKAVTGFGGGIGWNARDEAAPNVINSIFTEFAAGVKVDTDGTNEFFTGQGDLRNSIFNVGTAMSDANSDYLFTDASRMNTLENPLLGGISYTNLQGLNPRPTAASPALGNVAAQGAGLVATTYRGAFAPYDHWADQWTALSQMGYLSEGRNLVVVTNDIVANTTWFATNTYLLRTVVYVKTNVTLTIEPGTVIKAATSGLIARDGIPNLVAALWVARGAKLNAIGTVDNPIIFTFDGDNLNSSIDVPFDTSGQWGGVVLCGKAQINSAASTAGNVANPKYELFEGTTTDGTNGVHLFGGADDNDNSGTLRYVSIRYPGTVFAPAKELNGLTMGAVGRGTDISYVEVLNSSDDAFEWWGGTVNTHHLIAAFCEDDDFDTDQGYRGTNQFWFGIKPPWNGSTDSRGFETDGDLNQSASGELPKSQWTVHNATLIGRGKAVTGFGGGIGWNARDEAAPNVINSIFTEFAAGVKVDTDGTNEFFTGQGDLRNSIFNVGTAMSDANSDYLFTDVSRLNTVQDPFLGIITYTNNMCLNPRPQPGSPALGNVAPQGSGLTPTAYRGAFGPGDQWALGWTALYQLGYLQGVYYPSGVVVPICTPPNLVITQAGGMVNITWTGEAGFNYQVQSTTDLGTNPIIWNNEGAPLAGVGPHNYNSATGGAQKFFQVICQ